MLGVAVGVLPRVGVHLHASADVC